MVSKWEGKLLALSMALLVMISLAAPAWVLAQTPPALPDKIEFTQPGLMPEGIEWDGTSERFLISSLAKGSVYEVADDGTNDAFIQDPDLVSSVGLQIDALTNRLLVNNSNVQVFSDPNVTGKISLGIYDLPTGERLHMVDLMSVAPEGKHFANDIAVDEEGNAYVTDSFQPVIYKVDPDGNASIFVQDDRFSDPNLGLNGIDYSHGGYLLAAVTGAGNLFKIPITDTTQITQVSIDQPVHIDGMYLNSDGDLIAVENQSWKALKLHSDDNWASAQIAAQVNIPEGCTTVTIRDQVPYVLSAHINASTPPDKYEILRIDFQNNTAGGEMVAPVESSGPAMANPTATSTS